MKTTAPAHVAGPQATMAVAGGPQQHQATKTAAAPSGPAHVPG